MKEVQLSIAGVCAGDPAPGGWAAILRFGAVKKEFFGYAPATTADRMALMALIQGLLALKEPCRVEVTGGSPELAEGATKWLPVWKDRGWWKRYRPIRNADLWMELAELTARHTVAWGHTTEPDSRCRHLAVRAAENQISSWPDRSPHGELPLNLGQGYIPPSPASGSLFGGFAAEQDDESDPG